MGGLCLRKRVWITNLVKYSETEVLGRCEFRNMTQFY